MQNEDSMQIEAQIDRTLLLARYVTYGRMGGSLPAALPADAD
jgi:hypothetical protein